MTHTKGFEREEKFHFLLRLALADSPTFKAATLKKIIFKLDPKFMDVSRGGLKWATSGRVKTGHYFN